MNKPKLSGNIYGISVYFDYQSHVYVVIDQRGTKSWIRSRKSAETTFKRLVAQFEEQIRLGLRVV